MSDNAYTKICKTTRTTWTNGGKDVIIILLRSDIKTYL